MPSAEAQLAKFIKRFTPEIAAIGSACIEKMRERYPTATVLVYDNYNALAVGFAPAERTSEAVFSIAFYPKRVNLCLLQGGRAKLKDPSKLLQGSGTTNRFIPIADPTMRDDPPVRSLMEQALDAALAPFPDDAVGKLVIKSISERQRPRRPAKS